MAVSAHWVGKGLHHLNNKEIDLDTDTLKCALVSSAHTPNIDTEEFYSGASNSITANEITGTGYSAGGATLTTVTRAYDSANNREYVDCDDISWASSTITARYAYIYKTGTAGVSDFLLGYIDFGADVTSTNGPFTITIDSTGLLRFDIQ